MPNFVGGLKIKAGAKIKRILVGTKTHDFANTGPDATAETTISVPGASPGDCAVPGIPPTAAGSSPRLFNAYVSAADTVTLRLCAGNIIANPANVTYTVLVFKIE